MRYIYWLLLMATAVVAVLNFRIRCESFGCMGLGVAWFAWSGLYLVTLIAGFGIKSGQSFDDVATERLAPTEVEQ